MLRIVVLTIFAVALTSGGIIRPNPRVKGFKLLVPNSAVGVCPSEPEGDQPTFLPDSDNCQIYYECSNGDPVKNHCPDDLQWDTVLNTCDFPENVNCDKGKSKIVHPLTAVGECPANEGLPTFLPDSDDCQIYYECSNGVPVKNHCAGDLQWNTVLNTCDRPENVKCNKGEYEKTKIVHPLTAVGECPANEGLPTFLPDSDNCQIYYECSNGVPVKNSCAGDLQWNTVLNTCDRPENVKCNKGESKKAKIVHPLTAVGKCPPNEGLPTFLPDSENCQIYYECSNGVPVKNYCAGDLQWNTVLNTCDFPENVNCGNEKAKKTQPIRPYKPVGECPVPQGNFPEYLPDSDDCTIFYECDAAGVPVQKECMPGLVFNPALDVCDFPENVNCNKGNSEKAKIVHPLSAVGECPQNEGLPTFLPDSDNCQIYYECSNGVPVKNHCASDLQWNTVLNTCDRPENVKCNKEESKKTKIVYPLTAVGECPANEGLPTFLPDSDDCQVYYECSNGVPVKNSCAGDLQWNTVLNTCDRPENVKCNKGESKKAKIVHPLTAVGECPANEGLPTFLPDSDNCQVYYECSNGVPVKNSCAGDLQWNTVLNTCDRPENANCDNEKSKKTQPIRPYKPVGECPVPQGSLPVYLPDSDDCTIFYECDAAGVPVQKECMPGLQFNPTTHVCEFPETANCKAGSRLLKIIPLMKKQRA